MNINIEPIKVFVLESFLYNQDNTKTDFVKAKVIGIASYTNKPLTFNLLVNDMFLYSELPIHSFAKTKIIPRPLDYLCYSNCTSLPIDVFKFKYFNKLSVYFKKNNTYENGIYLYSIDFYEGNDMQHLILLDSGEFCLMPNHKINFSQKHQLIDYKKNRQNWTI